MRLCVYLLHCFRETCFYGIQSIYHLLKCFRSRPTWRILLSTTSNRHRGNKSSSISPPLWETRRSLSLSAFPLCTSPARPLKSAPLPAAPPTVLWLYLTSDPTRRKYGKFLFFDSSGCLWVSFSVQPIAQHGLLLVQQIHWIFLRKFSPDSSTYFQLNNCVCFALLSLKLPLGRCIPSIITFLLICCHNRM